MQSTILFEESQFYTKKETQGFLKIAIGVLLLGSLAAFNVGTSNSQQLGTGLMTTALVAAFIGFVMGKARLLTYICTDGIYIRYPPLQSAVSFFSWENIDCVYLRKYNPLLEYGGWGIKIGPMGRVYSVSGTIGLQLVFKDGSKLLIGTHQPEEMARVLQRMGKLDYFAE